MTSTVYTLQQYYNGWGILKRFTGAGYFGKEVKMGDRPESQLINLPSLVSNEVYARSRAV